MTWFGFVWKNLLRRPARTALTAAGVGLGVALIVALLSITAGVRRTAQDLIHIGRADFGLFQGGVADFTRSFLPASLARDVAREPGVAQTAKILGESPLLVRLKELEAYKELAAKVGQVHVILGEGRLPKLEFKT